jgi:putative transposase
VIRFIAEHKDNQVAGPTVGPGCAGVSSPCAPCCLTRVPISPSTYYEWINKTPTRRQVRDAELVAIITTAREDKKNGKFVQTLGSRKLWIWLRGQGHDVARCTADHARTGLGRGVLRVGAQDHPRR